MGRAGRGHRVHLHEPLMGLDPIDSYQVALCAALCKLRSLNTCSTFCSNNHFRLPLKVYLRTHAVNCSATCSHYYLPISELAQAPRANVANTGHSPSESGEQMVMLAGAIILPAHFSDTGFSAWVYVSSLGWMPTLENNEY
jgi:hypothetical protein